MMNIFQKFMEKHIIKANKLTVWKETDGCKKQYRCSFVVYLMIFFSLELKLSNDIEIGAPGHGKYVVDGLNSRYKGI